MEMFFVPLMTVIFLAFASGLFYLIFISKKEIMYGYSNFNGERGIEKRYKYINVQFFHWGSSAPGSDAKETYLGFFGIIAAQSSSEYMDLLNSFFDEVETDQDEKGKVWITVKKWHIRIGTKEFEDFLQRFDKAILLKQ
jgi:hypothetical protein